MTCANPGAAPAAPMLNLPALRRKSGLSLRQIAETTKISVRFLEAIEAEDFPRLPGGIFDRSYIRQYAAAIGIDPDHILAAYEARMTPPAPPVPARHNAPRGVRRAGLLSLFEFRS